MNNNSIVYLTRQSKLYVFRGIAFVLLFVVQQIVAFIWIPFKLVSPYWILYVLLVGLIIIQNLRQIEKLRGAVLLFGATSVGSLLTLINGDPIGSYVVKILYSLIGLVGLYYISTRRINLIVFDVLIPVLYIFFYFSFFVLDSSTRQEINEYLFGHSSSNSIAISLNVVWIIYYVIARSYGPSTKRRMLLLFSILNLLLIIAQGSRIGIVVAGINLVMIVSDVFKHKHLYFIVLLAGSVYLFYRYGNLLESIIDIQGMQGFESFYADVRSRAQAEFFMKMTPTAAIFGYPESMVFAGVNRSFNAFLDFWRHYGLLPLAVLLFFMAKRIRRRKQYAVPLMAFTSLFVYSFFESLWGATLWDILIYLFLFYSYEDNTLVKANARTTKKTNVAS